MKDKYSILNALDNTLGLSLNLEEIDTYLEDLASNKIIIEDYIDAKEVSLYFLTDGYSVFPIGSCMSSEDYSYPLTVFYPDNCLSKELHHIEHRDP